MQKYNLTGERFGRWTVLSQAPPRQNTNGTYWLCKCDCGTVREVAGGSLRKGESTSCGCWRKEWSSSIRTIHGMTGTRLHRIWLHMIERCSNPNSRSYPRYGAIGIKVCDEWKEFVNFAEWSLNNGYNETLTIDRINSRGNYSPDNCRWADIYTQANNRKNNHFITVDGITKTLSEWARVKGIERSIITQRIRAGWDEVKAVTTPVREYKWRDCE